VNEQFSMRNFFSVLENSDVRQKTFFNPLESVQAEGVKSESGLKCCRN